LSVFALFGAATRYAAALVLLYAAAQKLAGPRSFRQTLTALRVPRVAVLAVLVPLVEIAATVCLVVLPDSIVTAVLVAGLGAAFACAGFVALRRGEHIRCACYGRSSEADLGLRQLVALPVWFAVAAICLYAPVLGSPGAAQVALVAVALAAAVTVRHLLPAAQRNRSYLNVLRSQAQYKTVEPS
jgi:hypothetical protein